MTKAVIPALSMIRRDLLLRPRGVEDCVEDGLLVLEAGGATAAPPPLTMLTRRGVPAVVLAPLHLHILLSFLLLFLLPLPFIVPPPK